MKTRHIHLLSLFFLFAFSGVSHAREGDCVYALSNKLNAHCTYVSAPDHTSRYLEVIYNQQMAITSCVNNTILPFTFTSDMIGDHDFVPYGKSSASFYQCDNASCDNKKLISTDHFIVANNKTVTPDRFNIILNTAVGENCKVENLNPNNMLIITINNQCDKFPYCLTISAHNGVRKYIKVVNDQNAAFTYCTSNDNAFALGKNASPGTHTFEFYQCDNLACDQKKLISKEIFSITNNSQVHHKKAAISIDPHFGENCNVIFAP